MVGQPFEKLTAIPHTTAQIPRHKQLAHRDYSLPKAPGHVNGWAALLTQTVLYTLAVIANVNVFSEID